MALAYPGPAADVDHATSPHRSVRLPAGPGVPRPRRQVDLLAIADGFAVSVAAIPEFRQVTERTWVLVAVTDLFEAWAIAWPPGGGIELHDHGSSQGAVVVATGALTETTVRPTDRGVALIASHRIAAGEHRRFGTSYVHDLTNDGDQLAVSVHVYGPRLTSMRYYRLDDRGRLGMVRTEQLEPVGPFDTTAPHDPS
jgi:hypothetical protein